MNKFPAAVILLILSLMSGALYAQVGPSKSEVAGYTEFQMAAHTGNVAALQSFIDDGIDLESQDGSGRTALHIAAFASQIKVIEVLAEAGADLDALEHDAYDIVTIAAVANDMAVLSKSLELGASAGNVTSRYDGTALIAAAHLGHHEVVELLIKHDAPLDHVNNLDWTALIESVVLGNGGPNHTQTARHLLAAGADQSIGDRQGVTPLEHAQNRGYSKMVELFESYQK